MLESGAAAVGGSATMPTVEPFVLVGPAAKDAIDLTVRVPVASGDIW
jgi:hypothetical protein